MKIDDSNREYSESEVRSYIKGLNARIVNADGVIDELKKCLSQAIDVINKKGCCSCDGEWCDICQQQTAKDCDLYQTFVWEHTAFAKSLIRGQILKSTGDNGNG